MNKHLAYPGFRVTRFREIIRFEARALYLA
jgi:hypothetical protein